MWPPCLEGPDTYGDTMDEAGRNRPAWMRSCLRTTDWSGWLDAAISLAVLLVVQRASWVTAGIFEPSLQRVPTLTNDANDADDADDRY